MVTKVCMGSHQYPYAAAWAICLNARSQCSDGHNMSREIKVDEGTIVLKDEVEVFYERKITKFGNSAKLDAPKKYIGKRAYVIVLKK